MAFQVLHDVLEHKRHLKSSQIEWKYEFKLYDDDGILYYEGVADSHAAVEAAHDWGMVNAGVTYSKMRRYGKGAYYPFIG